MHDLSYSGFILIFILFTPLFLESCSDSTNAVEELSPPVIESFMANPSNLAPGDTSNISVTVQIDEERPLLYELTINGGLIETDRGSAFIDPDVGKTITTSVYTSFTKFKSLALYVAPEEAGEYFIALTIEDDDTPEVTVSDTLTITVAD